LAPNIESIVAVNVGRGKGTWFIVKQQRDKEDDEDDEPVQETNGAVGGQAWRPSSIRQTAMTAVAFNSALISTTTLKLLPGSSHRDPLAVNDVCVELIMH
jgi:hypothetical protein